ncbi:MAG: SLC13 family permease [Bacillus sp. (in: firmicutes)]
MTVQPMIVTFIILIFALLLFSYSKIRADVIAVGSLLLLTLLGYITVEEALAGFANPTVMIIAGLFVVGAGVFDSGLARNLGDSLLRFGGKSERLTLLVIVLIVSLFSAVISNSGTVALFLPVIMSYALLHHDDPSKFILPLAFAGSFGGLLTIIGSPANLLVRDALVQAGYGSLSFFSITGLGLVALLAGLLFILTVGRGLLPKMNSGYTKQTESMSAGEQAGLYKIYDRLHFLHVPEMSDMVGERLADLKLPSQYGVTIIEIDRRAPEDSGEPDRFFFGGAEEIIYPDDLLLVLGEETDVQHFIQKFELLRKPFLPEEVKKHFFNEEYGLTEVLIAPHSSLEDQSINDIHFREKYSCNVLAINRKGEYIQTELAKEKIRLGDALLVHGKWEDIQLLSEDKRDVVVLGSVEEKPNAPTVGKAPIAAAILIGMVILMATQVIPFPVSVMLAAFLMVITGCIRSVEEAYQRINLDAVVLIASFLPVVTALDKTGGLQFISNGLMDLFGNLGPYGLLIGIYLLTSVLSQFLSHVVTSMLLAPIGIVAAIGMGYSPYPFVLAIAIAAGMSFATPLASPTNALVQTAGGYRPADFVKAGLPLQIFIGIIMIIFIPLFFPFK